MASTLGRVKPELARQAGAALIMDRADLTHDATSIHQAYPNLPSTPLAPASSRSDHATAVQHYPRDVRGPPFATRRPSVKSAGHHPVRGPER